jgi:hypothetical protein
MNVPLPLRKRHRENSQQLRYDMSFELLLFKVITQYKLQVLQGLYPPGFILFAFRPLSGKQKNK